MSDHQRSSNVAKGWSAPRTWRVTASGFTAVLILTAAMNLWVNPFGLYWAPALTPQVDNLRIEKYEMLREQPVLPGTVILGSSRVMMMAPSDVRHYLPGECFNYGMKSAMAEDYYAALRLLVEDVGAPVQHVILGIDLEAFHPKLPALFEARYFPQLCKYFVHTTPCPSRWQEGLMRLLSVEQTEESVNTLKRTILGQQAIAKMRIEPDGSAVQIARERAIARGEFNLAKILARRVRRYPWRSLHLETYSYPGPVRIQYLDDLLAYCGERRIAVHAYITPLHPAQWEVLDALSQAAVLRDVAAALDRTFRARGVKLHDFSRIGAFAGDPQLFYDEMHMRPANHKLLLAKLLGEVN